MGPLISGKSRLVKYFDLARYEILIDKTCTKKHVRRFLKLCSIIWPETKRRYFPVSLHNFVVFIERRSLRSENPKKPSRYIIV